jgi:hypothetical protein
MTGLHRRLELVQSTPRYRWIATFILLLIVGSLWAISDPLFAPADEGSHTIRAAAVSRGQITGDVLTPEQADDVGTWGIGGRQGPPASAYRAVDVPAIYDSPNYNCFAYQPNVTPDCVDFEGPTTTKSVVTAVPTYPPAYYAWVGILSRPFVAGPQQMYAMRLASVLIMAGMLASALETIFALALSRVAALGFLVALTPPVLYFNGSVNPSAMEITGGIALWTSGTALARAGPEQLSNRLIARTGLAAIVLVLSRHPAPLWLALITLSLVLLSNRGTLMALLRRNAAWSWASGVGVATASTMVWIAIEEPFSTEHTIYPPGTGLSANVVLHQAIGGIWTHYRSMVGLLGWSDTPVPSLTIFVWTGLICILLLLAVAFCRGRRAILVLAGITVASVLVPVALDTYSAVSKHVGLAWQGRHGLPFAVGVPIVAGLLAATSESRSFFNRRVVIAVWLAFVAAQTVAFWQMLRKYSGGVAGRLSFWVDPKWSPPIPLLLAALSFPIAIGTFAAWCLSTANAGDMECFGVEAPSSYVASAH